MAAKRNQRDWLATAKIIGLIVLVLMVIIVVVKNSQQTGFWFFGFNVTMPKALMLFCAFAIGLLVGAWGDALGRKKK